MGAARHGDPEQVHMLLAARANIEATCHEGRTPAHVAAIDDRQEALKALVMREANLDAKDAQGHNPMEAAEMALASQQMEPPTNSMASTIGCRPSTSLGWKWARS